MAGTHIGDVEGTIDQIYECAMLPRMWPALLERLVKIVDAYGAILFTYDPSKPQWIFSSGVEEESKIGLEKFLAWGGFHRLPRIEKARQLRHHGFVTDQMYYTDEEMAADPFYKDFWWPRGFGYAAATFVEIPTGELQILTIERKLARGPVERSVLDDLDILRPHLARAAVIAARMRQKKLEATAAALELLGLPAVVLGRGGEVLAANALANDGILPLVWLPANRLALQDKEADVLLRRAVQTLSDDHGASTRSFPVRRADDQPPLVAHLIPARRLARDLVMGFAGILVLTDATARGKPRAELIQSLFDLTAAEARTAREIGAGRSITQIAAASGLSQGTIRVQLKSVFANCRRPAELVSLLSGLAL
jgi:DNA-binding CsgD family transcriptional regulator